MSADQRLRLLYFVGAGPVAMSRVDISHLYGVCLSAEALSIQWYLRSPEIGGPLMRRQYHGQHAFQCGRSRIGGQVGRVINKLKEGLAILHFGASALSGRHDVIQVRDDFFAGLVGLLAARLRGRPFVFWLSYPYPEARLLDAREGRSRWPLYSRVTGILSGWTLYRCLVPRADVVFVQSEQMKRDLTRPGVNLSRLVPVPMGLPDQDLPAAAPPGTEPLVLYLGTLARVRRLTMVVEAFARVHAAMPAARLAIVGTGDVPADRTELERAVAHHGLSEVVIFTGQVPRQEALAWIRRAAVCVSPFFPTFVLRSTSPTKLVEYLAYAKPVVVNDHPEQAEVIGASGGGICVSWNSDAFAQAMLTLLRDPVLCESMGKAGREWMLRHRRYSLIAANILTQYRALSFVHVKGDIGSRKHHP